MFVPRKKQQEVLNYTGGKMGVSAVPGSGKTQVLSYLAAKLIKDSIKEDQEVLIVTLVNSAVDNFSHRVAEFIKEYGLLPNLGYRVRTLHGLAHDIVRERPGLVGLSDDFQIIDERESEKILQDASEVWLRKNPFTLDDYLVSDMDENKKEWLKRTNFPLFISKLSLNFIKLAKDLTWTPQKVRSEVEAFSNPLPLLEMGLSIYEDYTRALSYRGAVDFDDLIRLALEALRTDKDYLQRLRARWPFILEDEAQDSSRLQEEILKTLSGTDGNWVRVGDPNQAIYETFTTANPEYLLNFLNKEKNVIKRELPNSGRSTMSIISLANRLIEWTKNEHPIGEIRKALVEPEIKPTERDDPQPNPPDDPTKIRIISTRMTSAQEIEFIVDSVKKWLPGNKNSTVAVLVTRNERGNDIVNEFKKNKIDYVELLKSTSSTREVAGSLTHILAYLSNPVSPRLLAKVYEVWRRKEREDEEKKGYIKWVMKTIKKCEKIEDFLWPRRDRDWLWELNLEEEAPEIYNNLIQFRELIRRWQGGTVLPIDQLILTLSQDLFAEPSELALAYKLAITLSRAKDIHPEWRLYNLAEELSVVAKNERKFLGFSDDDTGFEPEKYKGKVVITTMHKAKGLEWDRVYLVSVNNYDFPSGRPSDKFISEKNFIRGRLNLDAEMLAQLKSLYYKKDYREGEPTIKARTDYAAERLRLLYVGITRAKKELIITWNSGKNYDLRPADPLIALKDFREVKKHGN